MDNHISKLTSREGFDSGRLRRLVAIMEGDAKSLAAMDRVELALPAADGRRDVIVLKPLEEARSEERRHQHARTTADELTARGVPVQAPLDLVGAVSARVGQRDVERLQEEGYLVFDDRPRDLVPLLPAASTVHPDRMPVVDAAAWTGADQVQAQGFTGKGQVVAVVDSGFQRPGVSLVGYKDFVDGLRDPIDPSGHGTHVAGDVLRMAPEAGIVAVRVMNAEGRGRPSDIIRGIQWAVENREKYGITAMNLSLGAEPDGAPDARDPINLAVEEAIRKGITVVTAAGNSGPVAGSIGSPADGLSTITVGSARDRSRLSDFSSRGPTEDGLTKPDLVAPGEFIVSWSVPGSEMERTAKSVDRIRRMSDAELVNLLRSRPELVENLKLPQDILSRPSAERMELVHAALPPVYLPEPGLLAAPGTSFAAPIVAGIVANLKQAAPTLAPQGIKDALVRTADSLDSRYRRNEQGAGFVDAAEALDVVRSRPGKA